MSNLRNQDGFSLQYIVTLGYRCGLPRDKNKGAAGGAGCYMARRNFISPPVAFDGFIVLYLRAFRAGVPESPSEYKP